MVIYLPQMLTKIEKLYKSDLNVFNIEDLAILWNISNRRQLLESIKYYLRKGRLKALKRGVYITEKEYSEFELAQKLYTPSYISLYTALGFHGIIFQYYKDIYSLSLINKEFLINNRNYIYKSVKSDIFWNSKGIIDKNNFKIASPERAICDSIYLNIESGIDNFNSININKLTQISRIYKSKILTKKINKLINIIKNS